MLVSIAFLVWCAWAWWLLWASRQPHCQRTLWGRSGRAGSLCPSWSCRLRNPRLAVPRGCVCSVWFADRRWSIGEGAWVPLLGGVEEKRTPSEWLCMKAGAYWGGKKKTYRKDMPSLPMLPVLKAKVFWRAGY